jgi:hypothetical protein
MNNNGLKVRGPAQPCKPTSIETLPNFAGVALVPLAAAKSSCRYTYYYYICISSTGQYYYRRISDQYERTSSGEYAQHSRRRHACYGSRRSTTRGTTARPAGSKRP